MSITWPNKENFKLWLTAICGVMLSLGGLAEHTALIDERLGIFFYLTAYLSGGYLGFLSAVKNLMRLKINISFLMITAAIGAAFISQWLEGAILLFLFTLSGALESLALNKSRRAIHSLMDLRPAQGRIRHADGREELVPVEELKVGQVVVVKPGEHIPVDGRIVSGYSDVDQAAITGESVPVPKETGDQVFAATLNKQGAIEVEVTRPAEDTTLAKIIQLVEKAQRNKARTQRFLDNFEPPYVVGVVIVVLLLILIPWVILGQDFDPVFYRAMTVLVVASPCALIISTPASILSAIANAAKNGILFKGGIHIEQTTGIDTIALDKTGTLTEGKPVVTDLIPFNGEVSGGGAVSGSWAAESGEPAKELLSIAAGCELNSEHHLAEAIVSKAEKEGVEPVSVMNLQSVPGKGVHATWNGHRVSVGNLKLFVKESENWPEMLTDRAQKLRDEGKTVVYVVDNSRPIGLIALADQLRPQAKKMIEDLRRLGIREIVMLTGDNRGVAEAIGRQLDLDEVHAELLPEQKLEKIEELKKRGFVAMVGDGVNDAPALATSHLGISMGAAGTDVALETADVVLMGDDLSRLPYLIKLSRKSRKIVWQNITFSLAVIVMLLFGVFLIELPLTAGVIGHEGSTLLVVLNGLRLLNSG